MARHSTLFALLPSTLLLFSQCAFAGNHANDTLPLPVDLAPKVNSLPQPKPAKTQEQLHHKAAIYLAHKRAKQRTRELAAQRLREQQQAKPKLAALPNPDYLPVNTVATQPKIPPKVQFTPNNPQKPWFIKPTVGYMKMDMPRFRFNAQNQGTGLEQQFSYRTSTNNIYGGLTLGRHISNNHFLSGIFGQKPNIEFIVTATQNRIRSTIPNGSGTGYVVPLIGGGLSPVTPLQNPTLTTRNRFINGNLLFLGQAHQYGNHLALSPYLGIVIQVLNQDNSLVANANNPQRLALDEDVSSYYSGVQAGESINVTLNQMWFLFLNPQIVLAYAHANFDGNEAVGPTIRSSASDTLNKFSYIASLTGGVGMYLQRVNIILKLAGGVDYYSFMPEIVNPHTVPDHKPAHLERTTALDPFVTLSATLPF